MDIPKEILEKFNNENVFDEINEKGEKTSKYEVVSKIAYLLGLDKEKYDRYGFIDRIYEELENNKNAKIVRNLCILRLKSLTYAKKIYNNIMYEDIPIYDINDIYPKEVFDYLGTYNIRFSDNTNHNIVTFETEINKYIQERVGNIVNLFSWINYDYIREIFIMPNGTDNDGLKKEVDKYYKNVAFYPYGLYLNWPVTQMGNLLKNDLTFCCSLYNWHKKKFKNINKVTDVSNVKKEIFYKFITKHKKVLLVIDCENIDMYKLLGAFIGLNEVYLSKIYKIILVDDPNTGDVWKTLLDYINIPIEYEKIERVLDNKSLVDFSIVMSVQREFDKENIDSVIIASSDSDFFVIKKKIKELEIFVLTESSQVSSKYLETLTNNGIDFFYIDYFDNTNSEIFIKDAFISELKRYMNEKISINIDKLLSDVLYNIHTDLNEQEKKNYIEQYIMKMKIIKDNNGNLVIDV